MNDLRKAAEMALEGFEKIYEGFGFVKEEAKFRDDKDVRDLATEVRKNCNKCIKTLRQALAQPEHEPLVWMNKYGYVASFQNEEYKDPLYTAPPKKEWVGLTDQEVDALLWKLSLGAVDVRLIEAKLKEKNSGDQSI